MPELWWHVSLPFVTSQGTTRSLRRNTVVPPNPGSQKLLYQKNVYDLVEIPNKLAIGFSTGLLYSWDEAWLQAGLQLRPSLQHAPRIKRTITDDSLQVIKGVCSVAVLSV